MVDISLTVSPLRDRLGEIIGASKVARDITERKRFEIQQRLLLDELNHRVKQHLATVQAIATQSLARAPRPERLRPGLHRPGAGARQGPQPVDRDELQNADINRPHCASR